MKTKLSTADQNKINALRYRYDELISQYRDYLNIKGYIQPKDFEEFFTWFKKFRHPNKSITILEIHPNDLKRFHEYMERKIKKNNSDSDSKK